MASLPAEASKKPSMKERILETADRLFYLKGIRAIGVDTIAAEIGISKRTLYNHFPSKDALISAYLERRFVQRPSSDKSPVEQILGVFDSLERRFASKDFRGCPFVNAVAEMGPRDKSVKKVAVAFKESRRRWFRDLLLQLGLDARDRADHVECLGLVVIEALQLLGHQLQVGHWRFKPQIGIDDLMPDCQHRKHSFNSPACTQSMAGIRFGGAHGRVIGLKYPFNCCAFCTVIIRRTCSVKVDIINIRRF